MKTKILLTATVLFFVANFALPTLSAAQCPDGLTASGRATSPSSLLGNNGRATVTPSGGTAPYTYLWNFFPNPPPTTQTITGLTVNAYQVTVTDANGCTVTATVAVPAPNPGNGSGYVACNISASATSTPVVVNGVPAGGTATVTLSGATAPLTYLWNNNQTTQTITGLSVGTYSVLVTDENICTATASVNVPLSAATVPILSEWGLIALTVLLVLGAGVWFASGKVV